MKGAQGPTAGLAELANGPSALYRGVGRPGQCEDRHQAGYRHLSRGAQPVCPGWVSSMAVMD